MKTTVKATEKKVNNVVNNVESKSIDLLNAVKNEAIQNDIESFKVLINESITIESLNEIKTKVNDSKITNKDKLSLKKAINTKVQKLKINTLSSELIEKDKDKKAVTEKASFKIQVAKNLLNLNNIVKAIKSEDKKRIFEGKEIDSKYSFLFNRKFTNSIFYSFLTLRQFSKLAVNNDIFSHNSVIDYCERINKFEAIKLEEASARGKKVFEILNDASKSFEVKIIEFTKL